MLLDLNVRVRILGVGRAVPAGPAVSNVALLSLDDALKSKGRDFLEKMGARIESKYGVAERFLTRRPWLAGADTGDTSEDLAFEALKLAVCGKTRAAPSLLVHGTTTTSRYTGSQAAAILGRLGVVAPAYEVKAGCSTSLASLHMAVAFLGAGYSDVAVACAETLSKVMHPDVRETWFGLADGGAAIWLDTSDPSPDFAITRSYFSTDGRHVDLFTTRGRLPPTPGDLEARGYCLQGDKDELALVSREHYAAMLDLLFPSSSLLAEVDWIIPHQVNRELIGDVLRGRATRATIVWDAREFGNLGGASVLFSLARCIERGVFKTGDRILLMSVGGGLSSAAQVWEKL
jgi:3-oxoacyl-[acyl-carrier-protein] synthase III